MKTMLLKDVDVDAAGEVLGTILVSWSNPPDNLANITHQIAADAAYLRVQHTRSPLTQKDLDRMLLSRPLVNRALYQMFRSHPTAPQVHYEPGTPPTIQVRPETVALLAAVFDAPPTARRPPGRPRLSTRAELAEMVFADKAARRAIQRRLPRDEP